MSKDRNRVRLFRPDHPAASAEGYVYQYRLVMEQKLGRFLRDDEVVHHMDGDETNDHPDNLEVTTQSKHIEHHRHQMQNAAWRRTLHSRGRNQKGQFA